MIGIATYITILGGLALWSLKRPSVALTAIICMFSLEQWGQASSGFLLSHRTATNIIVGLVVLIAVINKFLKKNWIYKPFPYMTWLVFALFLYALLTTIWTPAQDVAFGTWRHFIPYLVTIVFLGPLLIDDKEELNAVVKSLVTLGAPLVFLLLFFVQWEHRRILVSGSNYETAQYGNPLEIGTFASILLIVVVFHKTINKKNVDIVVRLVVALLCIALIVESGSRGQLFAALLSIYILWPLNYKIRNLGTFFVSGAILFGLLILIWLAISSIGEGNIRWTYDRVESDIYARFQSNMQLLLFWLNSGLSIVFGLGNSSSFSLIGFYPHNVPIEVLSEEGILGGIVYIMLIFASIKAVGNALRLTKINSQDRSCVTLISGLLLFSFVISLKQGSLLGNLYFFMFAIIICRYELRLRYKYIKNKKLHENK